jgi:ribonuclease R
MIALINHSIPYIFPENVLKEAESLKPASLKGREDLRHLPFATIDPHDAKDHDDAVYAEKTSEGFIIYIAIADVAHYVTPFSSLDKEAVKRGNSVYFPDRVVPMLPEAISNELCSLKPYQDKAALVCRAVINENGRRVSHSFHRALIKSHAKLNYAEAEAAFNGDVSDNAKQVLPQIKVLYEAYASLKKARDKRQPLELNMPERKIVFGENGDVKSVIIPPRLDAHKLIEEMMILANVCAALTLEEKRVPCVYRIHDQPSHEKLLHLREFLVTLDIKLAKANEMRPANFNHILKRAEGDANEALINQVILQSQAQAEYNIKNIGHFGLNLQSYAHFTSPIRRYSDVLVHRGLIKALGLGDDGLTDSEVTHLKHICEEISNYERRAMAAERETVDRLIATYLAAHIDEIFEGRIAGLNNYGLFIKLNETGADGLLPVRNLGDDYYIFDERNRCFVGKRHGKVYKLGATVHVRLVEAAPAAGSLRFELVEGGEKGSRPLGNKERVFRKEKQGRPKHIRNSKRR